MHKPTIEPECAYYAYTIRITTYLHKLLACSIFLMLDLCLCLQFVETDLPCDLLSPYLVFRRGRIVEDFVDLLERQAAQLGEDDRRPEHGEYHEAHEDDVGLVTNVFDHHRGYYNSRSRVSQSPIGHKSQEIHEPDATAKFCNQLTPEEIDMPLARKLRGKTKGNWGQGAHMAIK
jgi:hypothetical protein